MLSVLFVAGVCLSGCKTQAPPEHFASLPPGMAATSSANATAAPAAPPATNPPVAAPANQSAGSLVSNTEVFRIGDSLVITFADLPTVTPAFQVKIKEDGTVTLLLNQPFKAAGKTPGQLEQEIRDYYVPRFFKYMTVTVAAVESTRWYYVYGEVRAPNRQIYNQRLTVLQAITSAGGFTDFANKRKIKLTRVDGRSQIINGPKAQEKPTLDPEVYPGDTVYVPRRFL